MKDLPQLGCIITAIRVFFSYVFPTIFTIAGAILLMIGAGNVQDSWNSKSWPSVEGTVNQAEVRSHASRGSRNSRSSTSYSIDLDYSYSVDGTELTGNRLRFGEINFNRRQRADEKAKLLAAAKTVKVFYDPDEPEKSVLEPGMHGAAWLLPAMGAMFFTIGTLMNIFLPRMFRGFMKRFTAAFTAARTAQENSAK